MEALAKDLACLCLRTLVAALILTVGFAALFTERRSEWARELAEHAYYHHSTVRHEKHPLPAA